MAIHWSNIAWGDFPNWLMALATIGALVAASLAAKWTFRTVKAAEKQVVAAQAQVETAREQAGAAREQLSLARAEVEREHEVAKAAEDRFLRAQLDGRMPVVYARATPGCDLQEYVSTVASQSFGRPALTAVGEEKWNAARDTLTSPSSEVGQPLTVSESERYVFAM